MERYAAVFDCAEINSTFYRPHRSATFERWAAGVPEHFRFALKLPKSVTHEARLASCEALLDAFLASTAPLGAKRDVLLVQLPPKLAFDAPIAAAFFGALRARYDGRIACEPRHATWFASDADSLLAAHHVARVAADPVVPGGSSEPGGWTGFHYRRLHGAPRMYWSAYDAEGLERVAHALAAAQVPVWCIFDNTASGAAASDALRLRAKLSG